MKRSQFEAETIGLLYGFLGVLSFSLTLPATRAAVSALDPLFVGLGRGLVAAALAAVVLRITRQPFPAPQQLRSLLIVAAGVVLGFPLLSAWLGFGYVSVVSQFLGFFAWYHGLALGGVARVSQLQLLQPFLTVVASAILLGEKITPVTVGAACVVVVSVAIARRAPPVKRRSL